MQQASTTTSRRRRAAAVIPHPELPPTPAEGGTPREIFWRAAWLRDLAQLEALDRVATRQRALKSYDDATGHALSNAYRCLKAELDASFRHLVDAGGLLYAWAPDA